VSSFSELGLSPAVAAVCARLGYVEPTPIQVEAIPVVARGRDVIGQAQTGSGKTAAFGLPMIDHVDPSGSDVEAIVLVPTRELAIQVAQAIRTFAEGTDVRCVAIFGGQPIREQTEQLKREPHIAVGTPGRVMDMIRRGWLPLHDARYVVLDEADEMLSLGFLEDVEWILRKTPAGRQTLLFSATMPPPIKRLADRYLIEPVMIRIESQTLTVDTVRQVRIEVEQRQKLDVLCELVRRERPEAAIVFRRRMGTVDELVRALRDRGIESSPLHGDMSQGQRDSVMLKFRAGRARLLVATNVAARGLDISHVSHVISYDVPDDPEEYTHRIGRTGRVGRSGLAYTFATRKEESRVAEIERATGARMERITAEQFLRGDAPARPVEPLVAEDAAPAGEPATVAVATAAGNGNGNGNGAAPDAPAADAAPAPAGNGAPSDPRVRLFVNAGRRHGVRRAQLVDVFREVAGVEPIRTTVHHAFSLVDVPADAAETAIERLAGHEVEGRALAVELAQRQPEPSAA
jgi:ATP-dependent RNA helicase DeaD